MNYKETLLKNKPTAITVMIVFTLILGVFLIRNITLWLQHLIQTNGWNSSLPPWFVSYGIGIVGLVIAVILIYLINRTFINFLKSLQ
jgi:hypothetical protein